MLFAGIPEQTAADVRIYWTSKIPEVNRAALAYFAASMFWRAAVHNWWSKRGDSPLTFGPYLEQLRQYLMGTANFPTDCALAVVISAIDSDATKIVQFIPATRRFRGCRVYVLHFLGIQFLLFVGKMFPQEYREMDFANGVGNPIIVTSRYERWMSLDLLQGYGRKRLLEMTARMKS